MDMQKVKIRIERERTESFEAIIDVDMDDLKEWAGTGIAPSHPSVAEYVRAHRDFPDNIASATDNAERRGLWDCDDELYTVKDVRS